MKKQVLALVISLAINNVSTHNNLNLSLESNQLYRQEFQPTANGTISTIDTSHINHLAKISGMDIVQAWQYEGDSVYRCVLTHKIDINKSNYNYVIVAEIDTAYEVQHPITSVYYLQPTTSIDDCKTLPGSYYTPPLTVNPINVYIHPTSGIPAKSRYRYEITTRNYAFNGLTVNNVTYKNLFLQSSGNGYGMLSGGDNTIVKNIVFQGGGTHHSVIASGTVDRSTFLPGPEVAGIAMAFYKETANNDVCKVTNCNFVDIKNSIIMHTGNNSYYQSLLVDNTNFWSGGIGDKGIGDANIDSTTIYNIFAEGYDVGYVSSARHVIVKSAIFKDCTHGIDLYPSLGVPDAVVSNCLITLKDKDGWTGQFGIRSNTNITINNNVIYAKSAGNATFIQHYYETIANHNIYIADVPDYAHVMDFIPNLNTSSDYNVFVLLRGNTFRWKNQTTGKYIYSLKDWQSQTGLDLHSVLIDLRNSTVGLKGIFNNPEMGDWSRTALTTIKLPAGIGLTTPPTSYPKRPDLDSLLNIPLPIVPVPATPVVITNGLEVYPNPFSNIINISYPIKDKAVLSVYDVNGRLLKKWTLPPLSSQMQITLPGLKTGTYYIMWSSGKQFMSKSIFKAGN